MRYDQKQFTQQGLNLFTNALSQKQSITIDKVIMDNLPTSNLSNLALLTLDDFANAQSFPANYTKVDNNMLTVDSVISNQGFTNSYSANEIGLVGHAENDSDETLIAILVASDPFVLPAQQQGETPLHLIPNVTIQLANNDMQQVPVDTAQDTYIPQQDLDSLVAQHGYIKLSDADDRYVKQDKYNSDIQTKANQSDLSNTNDKLSNKYDKSETYDQSDIDSRTDNAYQNAVNTAKSYVQNNVTNIQSFSNKNDAMNAAKTSQSTLCLYPSSVQLTGAPAEVKAIYSQGNPNWPWIDVPVRTPHPDLIDLSNIKATFNTNTGSLSIRGSVHAQKTINPLLKVAEINVQDLHVNTINGSFPNQSSDDNIMAAFNPYNTKIVFQNPSYMYNSDYNFLLTNSITLSYNRDLPSVQLPNGMPSRVIIMQDGDDLLQIQQAPVFYYIPLGADVKNLPEIYVPTNTQGFIAQKSQSNQTIQVAMFNNNNIYYYTGSSWSTYTNELVYAAVNGLTQDFVDYTSSITGASVSSLTGGNQPMQSW